jgi:NTE family protein
MRPINLVFEGGGVKGIAHVGALHALENTPALQNEIKIAGVGGTSAGAIVAALYAAGYSAEDLKKELEKTSLGQLIGEPVGYAKWAYRIWKRKGIYDTSAIFTWLRGLLERKGVVTFKDLHQKRQIPCRIVASDVTDGSYKKYTERNEDDKVASRVLQSLSIPIFFEPYADGDNLYVDGGMLSNYPTWLFDDSDIPTVGVRLHHKEGPGATRNSKVWEYFHSLVNTMLTAHDKLRISEMPGLKPIEIDARMVKSTDFHLTKDQEGELFNNGKDAVALYDWQRIPLPTGVLFKDPQAALILQETSAAINNIILNTPRVGKRCYERYEEIWTCLPNGDGVNETRFQLRNVGSEPTTLIRYTIAYDEPTDVSFRDCKFEKKDVQPAGCDVIILPLQNTRLVKEYALWFLPPILPGRVSRSYDSY